MKKKSLVIQWQKIISGSLRRQEITIGTFNTV